jgi:hypothetical protein
MSLSDCEKCWDTPCTCGHDYRDWSKDKLIEFVVSVVSKHPKQEQIRIMSAVLEEVKNKKPFVSPLFEFLTTCAELNICEHCGAEIHEGPCETSLNTVQIEAVILDKKQKERLKMSEKNQTEKEWGRLMMAQRRLDAVRMASAAYDTLNVTCSEAMSRAINLELKDALNDLDKAGGLR